MAQSHGLCPRNPAKCLKDYSIGVNCQWDRQEFFREGWRTNEGTLNLIYELAAHSVKVLACALEDWITVKFRARVQTSLLATLSTSDLNSTKTPLQ